MKRIKTKQKINKMKHFQVKYLISGYARIVKSLSFSFFILCPVSKVDKDTCTIKKIIIKNPELDVPSVETPQAQMKHYGIFMNYNEMLIFIYQGPTVIHR